MLKKLFNWIKTIFPQNDFFKFDWVSKFFLFLSSVLIIFSFFAPKILSSESKLGFIENDPSKIGDTIGGLMNPFIGIAGVILTFLAFYIQYKANETQKKRLDDELLRQKKENNKNEVERRFFEMLKLHKENVNEIEIINTYNPINNFEIKGRNVFKYLLKELELCYYIIKNKNPQTTLSEIYRIFFNGLKSENKNFQILNDVVKFQENNLLVIKDYLEDFPHRFQNRTIDKNHFDLLFPYKLFKGHAQILAHYYRHLFQTVKYIVNQDNITLNYEEKRNYIRILRSQLSNEEQIMLYYNWAAGFGSNWENEQNKFFTNYRMIHNIIDNNLVIPIDVSFFENIIFLKEQNRKDDPLFENIDI